MARAVAPAVLLSACIAHPGPRTEALSHRVELPSGLAVYARAEAPGATAPDGPLVLVPGASWLEHDLVLPGSTALFVDLGGRGRSDAVDPGEAALGGDLEVLEALRARLGVERAVLLGWGYYGALALRYALAHPERVSGLVLVAPLPPRREPHWDDFLARALVRTDGGKLEQLAAMAAAGAARERPLELCRAYTRLFVESRTVDPAAVLARMRSEPCVAPNLDPAVGAALGATIVGGLGDWDWRAELARIEVPTLVVHGRQDPYPLEGSEEYAAGIPGAHLVLLDDCGHLPWLERPEAFEAEVAAFLEGLAPERRRALAPVPGP